LKITDQKNGQAETEEDSNDHANGTKFPVMDVMLRNHSGASSIDSLDKSILNDFNNICNKEIQRL